MTSRYRLARSARRNLLRISDYWVNEAGEEVALRVIEILHVFHRVRDQRKAWRDEGPS